MSQCKHLASTHSTRQTDASAVCLSIMWRLCLRKMHLCLMNNASVLRYCSRCVIYMNWSQHAHTATPADASRRKHLTTYTCWHTHCCCLCSDYYCYAPWVESHSGPIWIYTVWLLGQHTHTMHTCYTSRISLFVNNLDQESGCSPKSRMCTY